MSFTRLREGPSRGSEALRRPAMIPRDRTPRPGSGRFIFSCHDPSYRGLALLSNVAFYGVILFLPQLIKGMWVTDVLHNGLISAIPWAVAAVAMVRRLQGSSILGALGGMPRPWLVGFVKSLTGSPGNALASWRGSSSCAVLTVAVFKPACVPAQEAPPESLAGGCNAASAHRDVRLLGTAHRRGATRRDRLRDGKAAGGATPGARVASLGIKQAFASPAGLSRGQWDESLSTFGQHRSACARERRAGLGRRVYAAHVAHACRCHGQGSGQVPAALTRGCAPRRDRDALRRRRGQGADR